MNKRIVLTSAWLLLTAIILGAFGAHGLKTLVSAEKIQTFEVGVRYQFLIALTLLVIGLNADRVPFALTWTFRLMLAGVLVFSGSIYLLALSEVLSLPTTFVGPLTPLGGAGMIVGCMVFIVRLIRS
jgi:uncharacterized membrane protein YgdD (TMEM256/DUF423 family)